MTKEDFYSEYLRLHKERPDKFMRDNPSKLATLYESMKDMNRGFLTGLVNRMIKTSNYELSIFEAVLSEKRSMSQVEKTRDIVFKEVEISESYFESMLKEKSAESLWDLIQKSK